MNRAKGSKRVVYSLLQVTERTRTVNEGNSILNERSHYRNKVRVIILVILVTSSTTTRRSDDDVAVVLETTELTSSTRCCPLLSFCDVTRDRRR